jgi:hypothetical protein
LFIKDIINVFNYTQYVIKECVYWCFFAFVILIISILNRIWFRLLPLWYKGFRKLFNTTFCILIAYWHVNKSSSPPLRQENFGLVGGLKLPQIDHKVTCNQRWKAFDSISIHWEVAALWNKFWWKKSTQNSDFWDVSSLPW